MIAKGKDLEFEDISSLSYGVLVLEEDGSEVMDVVLPKNTPYGSSKTVEYKTVVDNQSRFKIKVLQGKENRERSSKCLTLGQVQIKGLQLGPKGSQRIKVKFALDNDGSLKISAEYNGRVEEKALDNLANFSEDRL